MEEKLTSYSNGVEGAMPAVAMVVVQVALAGMNVLYKLAVDRGMSVLVLITYRYIFGSAFICPIAFFLERKGRTKLTWIVLGQAFCSGLFGATLNQIFYIISMKMTSATFVCAMANLLPAFTFMLAVTFRMERLRMKTRIGQAKVLGTLIGIGGAMLLTFYKGAKFQLWPVHSQLLHRQADQQHKSGNQQALGAIFAIAYALTYAIWLIIQAKMNERYPHPYSSTALMCLFSAAQSTCIAGVVDRTLSAWKLSWDVKLLTTIYGAVFVSAMVLSLMSWAVKKRGPVFVSVFSPLSLVITAILGSIFLDETLHLGSVLAAGFIILGLYIVLWGKGKEMEQLIAELPTQLSSGDPAKASFGGMLLESPASHDEGETKYKRKKENSVGVQENINPLIKLVREQGIVEEINFNDDHPITIDEPEKPKSQFKKRGRESYQIYIMEEGSNSRRRVGGTKVVLCMVVVQVVVAGMTVLYKISTDRGMSLRVLVAYRYIFGTALLCPLAFFLERKSRTTMSWVALGQAFCCSLFGSTLNQNLYIASVKMGSATLAVSISNLLPVFTFILAVLVRDRWSCATHLLQGRKTPALVHSCPPAAPTCKVSGAGQPSAGLALGYSQAIWFIIQAKMSERYPHPYTSTALVNLIAAVQCTCIAAITEGDASAWKLRWDVNLFTALYVGVVISGMVMLLTLWGIQKRGPLFVSVFNPLSLIIVAVFGSVMLEEPLYLGSVLGAGFIILGLYTVLWGKGKEVKELVQLQAHRSAGEATILHSVV
ncbi:uncharacterized protein LOC116257679 [Nymphaea colorata]|nr:uncharacterized protein LOC116257679 [Nymphaea colorata]